MQAQVSFDFHGAPNSYDEFYRNLQKKFPKSFRQNDTDSSFSVKHKDITTPEEAMDLILLCIPDEVSSLDFTITVGEVTEEFDEEYLTS